MLLAIISSIVLQQFAVKFQEPPFTLQITDQITNKLIL